MILLLKNTNQLNFIHLTLRTISNFLSQISPKAIKTIDLVYNQMDIDQAFSSESDEGNHSQRSEGRDTVTTESHRDDKKTKNIKKKYQPIVDGGKVYKFQDDPAEYKRLRKKIQNRQSATRVRGRKKNAFDSLEQEVEYLRKQNSQMQLFNAKLETENKALKDQIQFMKTLITPRKPEKIEDYLAAQVLTNHPSSQSSAPIVSEEYQSPFFQQFHWMRADSSSSNIGWFGLAIFTILVAVFVLPSENADPSFNAGQIKDATSNVDLSVLVVPFMENIYNYGKTAAKYGIIFYYIWIVYKKVQKVIKRQKMKKV